jgi:hypothetical protein
MLKQQVATFLLWLSGAAIALGLSILSVLTGSDGKINALALVPFVWTVALSAGAVQSLPRLPRVALPRVRVGLPRIDVARLGHQWLRAARRNYAPPRPEPVCAPT